MMRFATAVLIVVLALGWPGLLAAEITSDSQVVLYYFHGDKRCKTCRTIEAFAEETVTSRFAGALESGELVWEVVNYDDDENQRFVKQYGLVSASLVLVELDTGEPVRFEVLQKVWTLVGDKAGFDQYVRASVADFLE